MAKTAQRYLQIDPWTVTEKGFHPGRSLVSESIFSVGNEFMGVRGYFEEGYSGETLLGSYFNGVFEESDIQRAIYFKGFARRFHFIMNSVDWLFTRISLDGEALDLAVSKYSEFERVLDMRTGLLTRRFTWQTRKGKKLSIEFTRFTSMADPNLGAQRIVFKPLNFSGWIQVNCGASFDTIHHEFKRCSFNCLKKGVENGIYGIMGETPRSKQRVFSGIRISAPHSRGMRTVMRDKYIGAAFTVRLTRGVESAVERIAVNHADRNPARKSSGVWAAGMKHAARLERLGFTEAAARHAAYWDKVWEKLNISIEGDPAADQGIRFSIFQLHQTYHGVDPRLNISAKGLTGEQYAGHAWWDTETYCLPFYIFNNPSAARNLLGYRYSTLKEAVNCAREIGCEGARYPLSTIDGTNATILWQHGDLEIHSSVAVAYGIWHYMRMCDDKEFLHTQGIEMLIQICRFYASWGEWSPKTGEFGFWGVMGPDEFHMMVNNNCYTNAMVKKMFEYTLAVMDSMRKTARPLLEKAARKARLAPGEPAAWRKMAARMRIPRDPKSGVFEQHDGYFDMPHIDCDSIPPTQFPLYQHWPYIKIFRYDMIKQPDVLLLMLFFSHDYDMRTKRANYNYYEPRCIHESSLSPGVHSILAAELGMAREAYKFSEHAARLDLDDYNRNTHEGLHTTSMAAAWMNIVYGFGGMRSDGDVLSFNPILPSRWKSYTFRVLYRGSVLEIRTDRNGSAFRLVEGRPVAVEISGRRRMVTAAGVQATGR